jgi:hypothetical protein
MTSLLDVPNDLRGEQLPRLSAVPPYISSTGNEAIELAAMAGLELDPWQQWSLIQALGERPDGQWAAFGVGLMVSRQNGKGGLLEARELAGLFLLGEKLIIHSAHQFDTSQEAFERLVTLIESTPTLSSRLAKNGVTRSHGAEGIKLKTGQRIRFRTRTKGGGRGFTSDCLILDEAMILPDAFMGAVLPTLSARPNPQVWYTGSAVDQEIHEHGLVFTRVRERGLEGKDPSLFYAEWSAADSLAEVTQEVAEDPRSWARANPALGIRISTEYIGHERREFDSNLRGFAVERLGVGDWPRTDGSTAKIIDPSAWMDCCDADSEPQDPVSFAFDVTPDRSKACISIAGFRTDGNPHIEVVEHRFGTRWVVDRVEELLRDHGTRIVHCDAYGPAGSLLPEFEKRNIEIKALSAKEVGQACGIFFDAVTDSRTLRHLGTPELDEAVSGACTRTLGEAWAWSRKSSAVDISPLVSCTVALWGLMTTDHSGPEVWDLNEVVERMRAKQQETARPQRSTEGVHPNFVPL